jgi:phage/plasmid-like protein (TIGR03299 family)
VASGITLTDSFFSAKETPWHRLGVVLPERPASLDAALDAAGLRWRIDQQPVHLPDRREPVAGFRANVRSDTRDVLGIVSEDYRVVENAEAFAFLANLIGSELHFETAGSLWGGRQVFVTAEVPDWIEVGGDAVRRYVLVSTWHTGTGAVKAAVTPLRVVCNNTLRAALAGARDVYRVAHLGEPTRQLHEARAVLDMTVDYYRQFAAFGDRLALQPMSEGALGRVVGELYPQDAALGGRAARTREQAREAVLELFRHGDTVGNAPGSKWAAWNAIVEVHDHHGRRPRTAEGAFLRRAEDPRGIKARALALIDAV